MNKYIMMVDNKNIGFNRIPHSILIRSLIYCFILVAPGYVVAQKNYYIPSTFIIPVHTQANELHVSAGVSFGYSLNASYTISNRLALFASGGLANGNYKGTSLLNGTFRIKKDNYSVAGGMGYLFSPATTTGNVFEVFIGAGKYKTDNYRYTSKYPDDGIETYASYWSVFGQLNAIKKIENVEIGVATRLAYSNYNDLRSTFKFTSPNSFHSIDDLWSINAEPVLSISYIIKKVKLNAQGGFSRPLTSGNNTVYYFDAYTQERKEILGRKIGVFALIGSLNLQYNISLRK